MLGLPLWLAIYMSGPPGVSLPAICEMIEVEKHWDEVELLRCSH